MATCPSDRSGRFTGKRRIAIFLPDLGGGGAERAMTSVANGISALGHPVDMVLGKAWGPFLSELSPSVRVVDLGNRRVALCLRPLRRYLRDEAPAALLSAMSHANVVALVASSLAGRGIRKVVSERSSLTRFIVSEQASFRGWRKADIDLKSRLIRFAMWLLYRRADAVVTVSEDMRGEFPGAVAIANPVDCAEIRALAAATPVHPWMQSERIVLAAGRLVPQKDFTTLIRAFAGMARTAKLVILGEGPERPKLERLVSELGLEDRVSLPGFDPNPFAYMGRAALFVLSSCYEGLPGVLIQAMACGCPVVATDCPTGPREILEDGRWGDLVPVGDVPALAEAMEAALARDVHPDVRRRAADYSVEAAVAKYLAVLLPAEARAAEAATATAIAAGAGAAAGAAL